MEQYILKKLERLQKQVPIEKILHYHKQWRTMSTKQREDYDDKFVLYLRKNRTFRDLLLLNSIFIHIQKHFDVIFPYYFCNHSHDFLSLLFIKMDETEYILDELKYGITEVEQKRIDFTRKNIKKTKQLFFDFFQREKNLYFLIFYNGTGTTITFIDLIREIYQYIQ